VPSKRIRSKRTVAAAIANLSQTVTRSEQISTPYSLAQGAVSDGAIDQGVIFGGAFATGSISSRALGLSAYVPNGEGIQRITALSTMLKTFRMSKPRPRESCLSQRLTEMLGYI
jgi:hypothetical protein